jgi:DNA-binding transcriptional MocR family regulator
MLPTELTPTGPDMDFVEEAVKDPSVKGIWCVPIFSNPDGCVYGEETVLRFANLKPAAPDFRIYWDNAYFIHNFRGEMPKIPNIIRECEKAGNPNLALMYISFSKITFGGAGVAAVITSRENCDGIRKRLFVQTVGPDKMNMLRHARWFRDADGLRAHMVKLADMIRPKFDLVINKLETELRDTGFAEWTNPNGGYFVSVNTKPYCARETVRLCAEAGLTLTPAGAAYPHRSPSDRNIRIAPTYPTLDELGLAMDIFCASLTLASLEDKS